MHRLTERDSQVRSVENSHPYAVLGLRVGRQVRRQKSVRAQQLRLNSLRAELTIAALLVAGSDMDRRDEIAAHLALGLAYDVPMFTASMAEIADHALRESSIDLASAFRAAARAFNHARLMRASLVALARRLRALCRELRLLADLEPATSNLDRRPDAAAHLDLPTCVRLVQTVAPSNGPNTGTKALPIVGSVGLIA
ncbi:MAG: hypothetical protein F2840_12705 [Actinobacteria bacterium]|nr:hypothetical protein [Actinomycetota bacterium]